MVQTLTRCGRWRSSRRHGYRRRRARVHPHGAGRHHRLRRWTRHRHHRAGPFLPRVGLGDSERRPRPPARRDRPAGLPRPYRHAAHRRQRRHAGRQSRTPAAPLRPRSACRTGPSPPTRNWSWIRRARPAPVPRRDAGGQWDRRSGDTFAMLRLLLRCATTTRGRAPDEVWEVTNGDPQPHNLHAHDMQWQMLSIAGSRRPPTLRGCHRRGAAQHRSTDHPVPPEHTDPDWPYMHHCPCCCTRTPGSWGSSLW